MKTQFEQLEGQIRLAEMLNDASIDRVLAIDTSKCIIAWNKTCELITGITKEEVLGKMLFDVIPEMGRNENLCKGIDTAMMGYKVYIPSDKGSYSGGYYEHHFVPLKESDGTVIGVLNIIHDVAHRIKAENELKSLNKSLARKNKELRQRNAELLSFSHVTSHDLKEPLRKMYTFIEMILNKEYKTLSEESKVHFKRIQASAQRMSLLTDDILAFSQLHTEDQQLEEVDLNRILAFVQKNLKNIFLVRNASIESEKLPVIFGYKSMLSQLFQNIISNALKFQEPGNAPYIKVTTENVKGDQIKHTDATPDTEYVKISFIDNGIGFEKKYSERIFQMFQRLHNKELYSGTGIGLALSKKIIELHHGFITAESSLGKGSTFHCFLPTTLDS